ncbi:protein mono-ADP-ribosyltransferase PARP14-like isoform X2 [Saccostrea cucullata]|uniref:protein mono-ADP-ribosyltransferase PARP14-like isoform X2 n=1 Tax=Saccostrea cuccullata TaxID=36930 RepID=UPI002ED3D9AB
MANTAQDVIKCLLCRGGVRRYCIVCKRALCENCEEKHIRENGEHFVTDYSSRNDVAEKTEGECWVPPILDTGASNVNNGISYASPSDKNYAQNYGYDHQNEFSTVVMDSLILRKKQFQEHKTGIEDPNEDYRKSAPNSSQKSEKTKTSYRDLELKIKMLSKFHCTTKEETNVYVYCDSILNADVDVIVNAASEDLGHRAGVAAVIAKAAGQTLTEESKAYIAKYGKLKVTQVAMTSAGNLDFQLVLHVIGPRWKKYPNKMDCLSDLKQTILNALEMAQRKRATSIAFPAISAGGFEVPKELTAEVYAVSVHEFSKDNGLKSSIRDIHFVDIDPVMVQNIREAFENFEKSKTLINIATIKQKYPHIQWTTPSSSERTPELKKFSMDVPKGMAKYANTDLLEVNRSRPFISRESGIPSVKLIRIPDATQGHVPVNGFQFSNGLIVKIYTGSILKFHGDAIVISADSFLSGAGYLAEAVRKASGLEYENDFQSMKRGKRTAKLGDVFQCRGGALGAKYVMHLVLNQLSSTQDRTLEEYKSCLRNLIDEINFRSWKKVAIPLIGAGFIEKEMSDLQKCCQAWFSIFSKFAFEREHTCSIEEIHLVNHNTKITSSLIDAFENNIRIDVCKSAHASHFRSNSGNVNKRSNMAESERTYNHLSEDFSSQRARTWDQLRQSGEPPLTLKEHRHNSVKGNQPENGTMKCKIEKFSSLPGYENHGIIIITYHFPDGIQGPEHPHPGLPYEGTERKAYLPDNTEGQTVLRLLQKAFDRRLTFTIGSSLTTGRDNVIIWNGIQHKTQRNKGALAHGYPDPTYLKQVQLELAAKGVTE